ncbi:MAG: STAS domain-containing protein [Anaerolineae bacterium]|nr:STAS domain-containing protein [Anaerolineae bacterium]
MSEFATRELAGAAVIRAAGRLDALVSPELDQAISQVVEGGQVRLVVDCTDVSYISSSCLRVLLLGARRARELGGDLKLCCLSERVQQIFALAGFDLVFDLCPSEDEAVAAFVTSPTGPQLPCPPA